MHQKLPTATANCPLEPVMVYLLLGSNLGDKEDNLEVAIGLLNASAGTVISRSGYYETAAWGKADQPSFYNLALALSTTLEPLALLDDLLRIEKQIGRVRYEKWGPRLIDIDIIFYGDQILSLENRLSVPHPEMQNRKFVLMPLAGIAADFKHPVLKKTVSELLSELQDPLEVKKL